MNRAVRTSRNEDVPRKTPEITRDHKAHTLEILRHDKWVSTKVLFRKVGTDVTATISRLRGDGHKIEMRECRGGCEYSLVMTEAAEAALPVEINDCGKITIVEQRELK